MKLSITIKQKSIFLILPICVVAFIILESNGYSGSYIPIVSSILLTTYVIITNAACFKYVANQRECLLFVLFLLYIFTFTWFQYSLKTAFGGTGSYFVKYFTIIVFWICVNELDHSQIRFLGSALVIFWIYEAISLIKLYLEHPEIARMIISWTADVNIAANIGNPYSLAQGITFIAIVIFYLFLRNKNKKNVLNQIITIGTLILFTVCVVMTQSTITTITLFVGYFLCPLLNGTKNSNKKYIVFTLAVILLIGFILFKDKIGIWIINNFNGSSTTQFRMREIGQMLAYNSMSNDIAGRISLFVSSIKAFFEHPILGNLYIETSSSIGNHSEIVDVFAKFGVLGGIPFVGMLISYFKNVRNKCNCSIAILMIPFLVTAIFNPITGNQSWLSVLFVSPLLLYNDALQSKQKDDDFTDRY